MKNKKGFTIVELVIVIAVIAILAGVLIPTFSGVIQRANESAALQKATSAMKTVLSQSNSATIANGTYFISGDQEIEYVYKFDLNKIEADNLKENFTKATSPEKFAEKAVTGEDSKKLNTIIVPVKASNDTTTPSDKVLPLIAKVVGADSVKYLTVDNTDKGANGSIPKNSVKMVKVGDGNEAQYWGIILNADFASDIICLTYSK